LLSAKPSHLYNARVHLRRLIRSEIWIPALAIALRLIPGPRTIDDAYITFRYAQNLLSGQGMVYNPGERVLGTTTPLYALLMAALGSLSGGPEAPFPILAVIISALFDGLTCLLLMRLAETLESPWAGRAAAQMRAAAPMSVTFAIGGMETSFLVLLMVATLYFHSSHRHILAAATASLSILARPDALLFVGPLGLDRLYRGMRRQRNSPSLAEALAFLLPLLAWAMVGTSCYGNPIPHSILAKVSAYRLPPVAGMVRMLQHFATPFFEDLAVGPRWVALGIILYPALHLVGWRRTLRHKSSVWPLALYPLLYLVVFSAANPLIFRWYLTPPLPMYLLGIFLGLDYLGRDLHAPLIPRICLAAALGLTLNAWTLHPDHGLDRPAPEMAFIRLELAYEQAAADLRPLLRPDDVLAAGDIGALGYYTQARILDTVGLISPESIDYYPLPESFYTINYAIPPALITDRQPDYLVMLEVYGREGLLRDPVFNEMYRLRRVYPSDIYGSVGMLVFERAKPEE